MLATGPYHARGRWRSALQDLCEDPLASALMPPEVEALPRVSTPGRIELPRTPAWQSVTGPEITWPQGVRPIGPVDRRRARRGELASDARGHPCGDQPTTEALGHALMKTDNICPGCGLAVTASAPNPLNDPPGEGGIAVSFRRDADGEDVAQKWHWNCRAAERRRAQRRLDSSRSRSRSPSTC